MKRAVFLLALVSACMDAPSVGPAGFMAASPESVIFVQWTESSGRLSGTIQMIDNSGGTARTISISGLQNGEELSLVLEGGLAGVHTWTGKLQGDVLFLRVPQSSGGFVETSFKRATGEEFNRAAAEVRQAVAAQRQREKDALEASLREAREAEARRNAEIESEALDKPVLGGVKEAFIRRLGRPANPDSGDFNTCPQGSSADFQHTVSFSDPPYNAAFSIVPRVCRGTISASTAFAEANTFLPSDAKPLAKKEGRWVSFSALLAERVPRGEFRYRDCEPGTIRLDLHDGRSWVLVANC